MIVRSVIRGLCVVTGLLVCAGVCAAGDDMEGGADPAAEIEGAPKAPPAAPAKKQARPAKKAPKGPVSFTDDMEALAESLSLTDQQKETLSKMREKRDKELDAWDRAHEKQFEEIDKMGEGVKESQKTRVEKKQEDERKELQAKRAELFDTHERKMFAVLNVKQKGLFNGPRLEEAVGREFSRLSLSEDQDKRIADMCRLEGGRMSVPAANAANDNIVASLKSQVEHRILTPKQRTQYKDSKKRPAANRAQPKKKD